MPKAASEILAPSAHASPPLLQAWLFQDVRSMPPSASGPHALLGALAWAGGLLRILAIAYSAKRPAAANQAGAAASSQSSALATSLTCRDAGSPARPSRRAPDACARRANSGPAGTCRSSSRIAIGRACHCSRDSRRPHSSSLWAYGERQPAELQLRRCCCSGSHKQGRAGSAPYSTPRSTSTKMITLTGRRSPFSLGACH